MKTVMRRRGRAILVALSAALAMMALLAWVAGACIDPCKHFVTLGRCHISLLSRRGDVRLVIFGNAEYGPYQGSILSMSAPGGPRPDIHRWSFGDFCGIYVRLFKGEPESLSTVAVSLAYPLIALSILPTLWLIRWSRRVEGEVRADEQVDPHR